MQSGYTVPGLVAGEHSARTRFSAEMRAGDVSGQDRPILPVTLRLVLGWRSCSAWPTAAAGAGSAAPGRQAAQHPVEISAERVVLHQVGPGRAGSLQPGGIKVGALGGDRDTPEGLRGRPLDLAEQAAEELDRLGVELLQRDQRHDERVGAVAERAQVDALPNTGQLGKVVRPGAVSMV